MLLPATPEALERAAELLRGGGVVAFPTETVYGLGANAFDATAVARIFEIKERPAFDPLIVHVLDEAMLAGVAGETGPLALALMERFWPGALTLVLRKQPRVPGIVTSGLGTVAVRMPSHPVARELLRLAGVPLAAPSANRFGSLSPTRAAHVAAALGDRVDAIVDGGATQHGIESTILALEPRPVLLRPGAIALEEIEALAGPVLRSLEDAAAPLAPGRLPQHYAPRTPVRVIDFAGVPAGERARSAALAFTTAPEGYARSVALSPGGDLREAASRLFEALHALDADGFDRIDAQAFPERGLGLAIADRLRRAASR